MVRDALLLFIAAFAAAGISGSAGFGGALLLLPVLVSIVGPATAVPLLTVAQLAGNLSRAGLGFRCIRWRPVGWFLLGAAPAGAVGAFIFVQLPGGLATRVIGAVILLLVTLRVFGLVEFRPGDRALLASGAAVGLLSGLVGSAGPLGAAVFLSLDLPPAAYIASEATTALTMHGVKTLVYGSFIELDREFWGLALLLAVAMVAGTWVANRVVRRMNREAFQRYVAVLLVVTAVYMLMRG